jgi:hypothetical protein
VYIVIIELSMMYGPTSLTTAEQVVFLYKLAAGACPKSYGNNVARLAGLPASVRFVLLAMLVLRPAPCALLI